ncbi:hypothetical protein T459_08937 [Capsicum annuum]|uniref:Uncharacterized protein n=1 Tax=Capsicum annuum TaxID=4072 RepID=A0A2G2ZY06_CAPAN|nr:hypothetical protein T459_08937 [Capsicum annuum]
MKIDVEFMIVKKIGVDFDYGADLIVSISRNVDLNDGLWYEIENSTDVKSEDFKIPQNVYIEHCWKFMFHFIRMMSLAGAIYATVFGKGSGAFLASGTTCSSRWDSVQPDERLTFVEESVLISASDIRRLLPREIPVVKCRISAIAMMVFQDRSLSHRNCTLDVAIVYSKYFSLLKSNLLHNHVGWVEIVKVKISSMSCPRFVIAMKGLS